MKRLLRSFLITLVSLAATMRILPSFSFDGSLKTLAIAAILFMFIHIMVVPLIKIMLLPLNLLTMGIFAWIANVLGLYVLTLVIPQLRILPYHFPGLNLGGFNLPVMELNILQVAICASFLIGLISNFLKWLIDK